MSGPQKQVRFKRAWQTYRVGDIITPNGLLRDWLVGNGYCEPVDLNAAPPNTAKRPLIQRVRNTLTRAAR